MQPHHTTPSLPNPLAHLVFSSVAYATGQYAQAYTMGPSTGPRPASSGHGACRAAVKPHVSTEIPSHIHSDRQTPSVTTPMIPSHTQCTAHSNSPMPSMQGSVIHVAFGGSWTTTSDEGPAIDRSSRLWQTSITVHKHSSTCMLVLVYGCAVSCFCAPAVRSFEQWSSRWDQVQSRIHLMAPIHAGVQARRRGGERNTVSLNTCSP